MLSVCGFLVKLVKNIYSAVWYLYKKTVDVHFIREVKPRTPRQQRCVRIVVVLVAFVLETRVNARATAVTLLNLVFEGELFVEVIFLLTVLLNTY